METAPRPEPSPAPHPAPHPALVRARDFILLNYARPIRLAELEQLTRMSRFHLVRRFKKFFGHPPHAYQIRVRIDMARAMLRRHMTAAAVAVQTGFSDQSHFCRHFKRATGLTPREYARAASGYALEGAGSGGLPGCDSSAGSM